MALPVKIVNRDELFEAAGMRIAVCMRTEFEHIQWQSTVAEGFWIGIILSGSIETTVAKSEKQVWGKGTKHAFWSNGDLVMEHKITADAEPFAALFIHLSNSSTHELFDQQELESLRQLGTAPLLLEPSPVELTLAWRILGCKAQGLERKLYLTSRAIDLVSSVVSSFFNSSKQTAGATVTKLSPTEIERIYRLSNQLLVAPNEPPSADILARQVGMNMRKINTGFRRLFGVTMYGFIIQSRLDKARTLLEAGEHNVAQAADSVGYDPAHFSTAFRKRFGLPPSAYSKSNNT